MAKDDPANSWSDRYFAHPLPEVPEGYPLGWMTWLDLQVIYNAARTARGLVLEVGPFIGRSTVALALGLRDREADGGAPVPFDTIDFGITSAEEWAARFDEVLHPGKRGGRVMDAVYHPGGTVAVLIQNLKQRGLLPFVTSIVRGDILTSPLARSYGLIFCDAAHDDAEIERNLPRLADLAGPGCTFIFDDIINDRHADMICGPLGARRRIMTRTLHPERRKRCKIMIAETD